METRRARTSIIGRAGALVLALAAAFALSIAIAPATALAEGNECGDGVIWALADGTLTINYTGSGSGKMNDFRNHAPWYDDRDSIKAVVIGDGVTSIGIEAFADCMYLESVEIPDSVKRIERSAFADCMYLESVTIPDGVTSIGDHAFYRCNSLQSVVIPSSVTFIADEAFAHCFLKDIYFIGTEDQWNSVQKGIGWNDGNPEGQQVHFLFKVTAEANSGYIAGDVFIETDPNGAIDGTYEPGTEVTVVASWYSGSYGNATFVNWTEDGKEVSTAAKYTFAVTANRNLTANFVYSGKCGEDLTWTLDGNCDTLTISGTGDMYDYSSRSFGNPAPWNNGTHYDRISTVAIGEDVTSIGSNAFYGLFNLTSVEIPASVSSIGESAFGTCGSLSNVEIPAGVTSIGDNAFYYCKSLQSVTFAVDSELESIGDNAFIYCESLQSVEIPSSVTSIGSYAFIYCKSLQSVEIPSSVTSIGNSAFSGCDSLGDIYVDNTDDKVTTEGAWNGDATVHWRHAVATAADPDAGGKVEVSPDTGEGPYWDKDPGTQEPTVITVEAAANKGYVLASVVATWEDQDGDHSVTLAEDQGDPGKYSFDMPNADVMVTGNFKAKLTITAGSASKTYDGTTLIEDSYTSTALAAGDRIESVTVTGSQTVVGTSDNVPSAAKIVNANGQVVTDSYAITYENGTLEVERAPLTVTARPQTCVYNGETQGEDNTVYNDAAEIAEKVVAEGLQGSDALTSIALDGQGKDVGEYALVPSDAAIGEGGVLTGNYDIEYVGGTLTIKAAPTEEYAVEFVNYDGTVLQSGKVAYGEMPKYEGPEPTRPATAQCDYVFSGWEPEIAAVMGDATYKATFTEVAKKGVYKVVSGAGSTWKEGSSDPLVFTFKRTVDDNTTFGHFAGILVDGKAVPEKDALGNANWTAKSGSAIVSLQPAYLATLAKGDHVLMALFDDGNDVEVAFKTAAKDEPAPKPDNGKPNVTPKTGDDSDGMAAALVITATCALCFAAFALCQVRRRTSAAADRHVRR